MGIKNVFNQKFISKAPNPKEEALYKRVLDEMDSGKTRTGIMAKAIADSLGDTAKAQSLYIKYRMQTIADEDKKEAQLLIEQAKLAEEQAKKEAAEREENERLRALEEKRNTRWYKINNFIWKLLFISILVISFIYLFPNILNIIYFMGTV
jgi:hypothetical protein